MADRRPLTSDISDSAGSTPAWPGLHFADDSRSLGFTHISPPTSPPASRPGFSRLQSDTTAVERNTPSTIHEDDEEGHVAAAFKGRSGSGLGIETSGAPVQTARRVSIQAIPRRAVGHDQRSSPIKSPNTLSPPGSASPFADHFVRDSSNENTPDLRRERISPRDDVGTFEEFRRGILKKAQSSTSINDYQQYIHTTDTERLRGAPSMKSAYENDFRPAHECPTAKDFYQARFTWLNVSIIIICLFSCVFSGTFVGLAFREPFYGRWITSHGPLTPTSAILLTTVFAKLIELSFVTVFVAFLGQVLSRRAFMKDHGRGVTLSELSMWRWIVQPGTLITHPETVRYAALSLLGIASLVSAVLATLYSSAAAALVQPSLRQGSWTPMNMSGRVHADFANVNYVKKLCQTPIKETRDKDSGSTCLQIEHAGQAYHNYQRYLAEWKKAASFGNGTSEMAKRPPGFGLLYENTTVTAQWINITDTAEVSKHYGRAINNVSLAMPHAGVFEAAHSSRNGILQPEELNSEGSYFVKASVPSPVINVLCVNMNRSELIPIVDGARNITTLPLLANPATGFKETEVDEIFGWNNETSINYPPVFAKYPEPFNTIMNHTSASWGRAEIYLLGQGGKDDSTDMTGMFSLCRIHMSVTAKCATQYNALSGGGAMEALCEDKAGDMALEKVNPNAREIPRIPNWRDIGFDWSNSLSLNTGIVDANASNSRLLTQLMLVPSNSEPDDFKVDLSRSLPSMGEALAVMSGCTLLKSMMDAPFVTDPWDYSDTMIEQEQHQYFNAYIQAQQYASGGLDKASSKGWVIVLLLVFFMNILVLIYFIIHRGLVTDFSEPPNLFALAVNSPPSHVLAGSCGGGPEGKQYMVNWFVNHEGNHLFMEPGEKTALLGGVSPSNRHDAMEEITSIHTQASGGFFASMTGAIRHRFGMKQAPRKLRKTSAVESLRPVQPYSQARPSSTASSEYEMQDGYERTRKNFSKLSKRTSVL